MTFRSALIFCVILTSLITPAAAFEEADIRIPEESVFVIRVRKPKESLAKTFSFLYRASPILSTYLLSDESDFGELTMHPLWEVVDLEQDILVGGYINEVGGLAYYWAVTPKDEEALLTTLEGNGAELPVLRRDSQLWIGADSEVIERLKRPPADDASHWKGVMSEPQLKLFDSSDFSAFVNTKRVYEFLLKSTEDESKAREQFLEMLEPLSSWYEEETFGRVLGPDTVLAGLNAIIDSSAVVVGCTAEKEGLAVDVRLRHDAQRRPAEVAKSPLSTFEALKRMPPDRQCYALGTAPFPIPAGWFLEVLNLDDLKGEEDKTTLASQRKLMRRIGKLPFGQWATAVSFPTLTARETRLDAVAEIEKPDAFRLMNNKLAVTQSQFLFFQQRRSYELLQEKGENGQAVTDVHRVTYQTNDKEKEAKGTDYEAKLHGPNGLISRCMYDEQLFVNTVGGGPAALQEALRRLRSKTVPELGAGLAATRAQLPAEGSYLLLVDLESVLRSWLRLEVTDPDPNGAFAQIIREGVLRADQPNSYFGLAIVSTPEESQLKIYLPSSQASSLTRTWILGAGELF